MNSLKVSWNFETLTGSDIQSKFTVEDLISDYSGEGITSYFFDRSFINKDYIRTNKKKQIDTLEGLKENVIVGHRIPAGTGMRDYDNILVGSKDEYSEMMAAKEEFNY